jgi:hypothetical protein
MAHNKSVCKIYKMWVTYFGKPVITSYPIMTYLLHPFLKIQLFIPVVRRF